MQIFKVELNKFKNASAQYIGQSYELSYKTNSNEQWIRWGPNNDLPYWLASIYNYGSPTHNSLVDLKASLCAGAGFLYDEENNDLEEFIEENDLHEVFEEAALDMSIYNGFALQVIWNEKGKQIANIECLPLCSLRVENPAYFGRNKVENVYVSSDWTKVNYSGFEPKPFPLYNPENARVLSESGTTTQPIQILYWYKKSPNNYFYPVEPYRSGLDYIQLEKAIGTYNLKTVKNNFTVGGILHAKQNMDKEEAVQWKRDVKAEFVGEENANALMVTQGEFSPEYIPIPSNANADLYNAINDIAVQKIVSTHKLNSPALAGLPTKGASFGTSELSTAFEYYSNTIVRKAQKPILNAFAKLFLHNGLIEKKSEIGIESLNAVQFKFGENILLSCLSKNELRIEMGYSPREDAESIGNAPVQTQQQNQLPDKPLEDKPNTTGPSENAPQNN